MNISKRPARFARAALLTAAATGAGVAGLLGVGGIAQASTVHAHPDGWSVTNSCTGVSGKVLYSPGLRKAKLKTVNAVLTGTTSGCWNYVNGAESGTGTLTAILSGNADKAAENFSGTFTINWPASANLNPSDGTLSVTEANGVESVSGYVTSGAMTGGEINWQYVITGHKGTGTRLHPITQQSYVNTQPLDLLQNFG